MSIQTSLSLSVASGDGQAGNVNLQKSYNGLVFNGGINLTEFQQTIGVVAPPAPAPTTLLAVPGSLTMGTVAGGNLAANTTFFYKVSALNAVGETLPSAEANITTSGQFNAVSLAWSAVTGASSYRIYRGTASGAENTYYTSGTNSYIDTGSVGTAGTPAISNTTQLSAPGTVTPTGSGSGGTLAANTYFYKVTATTAVGETTASPEANVTTSGSTSSVGLAWGAVTGATGYKIYRGTTTNVENVFYTSGTNSYTDTNAASTGGTPPGANTTQMSTPGTVTPSTLVGGQLAAGTYYYKVTALNAAGETTGSPENSQVTTGANSLVTISWTPIAGAASYRIYRGTLAGAESVFFTSTTGSFSDTGGVSTAGTVPLTNGTGASGSVVSGVYFVKVTYVNAPQGESLASVDSAALTCLSSSSIFVPSPPASGSAASYNVYITASGGSAGTETKQTSTPIAIGTAYTQTAAVSGGAALPGSNTTLTWAPTIPQTPAYVTVIHNMGTVGNVGVSWTLQGDTSKHVQDLTPGGVISYLQLQPGTAGGISAASLVASVALCSVEGFWGG